MKRPTYGVSALINDTAVKGGRVSVGSKTSGSLVGAVVMLDVAQAAGVSLKTVSRVVNGSHQVRPEVRDRVMTVIDALGYRPNSAARALAVGRTKIIGIVAPGSSHFGVAQHVVQVERTARECGYGTVVVTPSEGPATSRVTAALERAMSLGAEGVVLVDPMNDGPADLDAFAALPIASPRRQSGPDVLTSPLHSFVTAAEEEGGWLATEHLVALGHERVAHISGPPGWEPADLRARGWRRSLQHHGLPALSPVPGDWTPRSGYLAMRSLLSGETAPTAVFVSNDSMAVGAMRAVTERGATVPDEVAVVGFDDLPESAYLTVPLTSVRQDCGAIARLSVHNVVQAIEGHAIADRAVTVAAQLVIRASSGGLVRKEGDST